MAEPLTEEEEAALELIARESGIHQSEFWKEMDISSRKGSRLVESLEEKGHVEREESVYDGHTTYYIEPIVDPEDLDFSLLMAGDMLSPFVGDDEIDANSDKFTQWVMTLAYE
ncbi:MAG: helix-turn-helix domain-containing protein [Halobacteriales archaeon]|nr:helix-turn-helix domain-containing protein [Halobacteriales archaeon]